MTIWDELATAEAERRDRKDSDWYALHADDLFRQGAAWQREQLLADEAVERAARELNKAGWTCGDRARAPGHYDDCPYCRGTCLALARTALTAATGDQS